MTKGNKNVMYTVFSGDGKEIDITEKQLKLRNELIAQFVECRKRKGWTQQELSKRSGITRSNITRFESGRYNPTLEMVVRVAAALEVELTFNLDTNNNN